MTRNEPYLWGDYERLTNALVDQGWTKADVLDFVRVTLKEPRRIKDGA